MRLRPASPFVSILAIAAGFIAQADARPTSGAARHGARIVLSRHHGPPGTRVRVRGRRFPPRTRVELRFGRGPLKKLRVRRSGRLRTTFRVPRRPPGLYAVVLRSIGHVPPERRRRARARFRITPGPTAPQGISVARPPTYRNPVYGSAPDPMAIRADDGSYYEYSTGSLFPVARSRDLVSWTAAGTALSTRPSWVVPTGDSHPWAPSVLRSSKPCPGAASGPCYLLYYVGLSGLHTPTTHCVAVATSARAAGPFADRGPLPAIDGSLDQSGRPPGCGDDAGYSNIDPAPFVDSDGRAYLYVSTNRRCTTVSPGAECAFRPTISVIPLTSDLLHAGGPRKPLFAGDPGSWEQQPGDTPKVENPWAEKRLGRYYILYSGGEYRAAYGMGYALGSSPMGPFTKAGTNPILRESGDVLSPGGGMVVTGPHGGEWLLYHGRTGDYGQPRTLRIDPLSWGAEGKLGVDGPTSKPRSPLP